jgi:hypothetical protein
MKCGRDGLSATRCRGVRHRRIVPGIPRASVRTTRGCLAHCASSHRRGRWSSSLAAFARSLPALRLTRASTSCVRPTAPSLVYHRLSGVPEPVGVAVPPKGTTWGVQREGQDRPSGAQIRDPDQSPAPATESRGRIGDFHPPPPVPHWAKNNLNAIREGTAARLMRGFLHAPPRPRSAAFLGLRALELGAVRWTGASAASRRRAALTS